VESEPGRKSIINLRPNSGALEIRYTAPEGTAPEELRFRYRLTGLNERWFFGANRREATFVALPPGEYQFQVQATLGEAPWPSRMATLDIKVSVAWYERTLTRILGALFGALGLAWLVRTIVLRRVQLRIRRLEEETALERERARIARDMHDEIESRLTRIALMGDLARLEGPDQSGERFAEISKAARTVSATLDGIVWTVNPQNDTLERVVDIWRSSRQNTLRTWGWRWI